MPSLPSYLFEELPDGALIRQPLSTGALNDSDVMKLWELFEYLNRNWEMDQYCALSFTKFGSIILQKTQAIPSYLTEYNDSVSTFLSLEKDLGTTSAAIGAFFSSPTDVPSTSSSRLGHIRKYLISEFTRLALAFGGFKRFGYINYRGYAGGTYSDPSKLPYRGQYE